MPNHCLIPMLCGIDFSSWEEVHELKGQNVIILMCCVFFGFYSLSCLIQANFSEKSRKNPAEPKQSSLIATDLSKRKKHININCYSYWLEFKIIFLNFIYRTRFWFFFFFFSCNLYCPSKFSLKWTYCLSRFVCLSVKQVCF